jgi:uncharacterized protein
MEERIKISTLLDLYGELLTEKQKDILNMYYTEDLSLSEISEVTNTTRQAAFDIIKRCHKLLLDYELKLQLMQKYKDLKAFKNNLLGKLESIKLSTEDSKIIYSINAVKDEIMEFL